MSSILGENTISSDPDNERNLITEFDEVIDGYQHRADGRILNIKRQKSSLIG